MVLLRFNHTTALLGEQIYMFGGSSAEDSYYKDIYILDTGNYKWVSSLIFYQQAWFDVQYCMHRNGLKMLLKIQCFMGNLLHYSIVYHSVHLVRHQIFWCRLFVFPKGSFSLGDTGLSVRIVVCYPCILKIFYRKELIFSTQA